MSWTTTSIATSFTTSVTATIALAVSALVAAPAAEAPTSFDYEVVTVKRKLLLEGSDGERELQAGDRARSGDVLRTGWRSRAELVVAEQASRFIIASRTRVRLAHERPGVLLEIERGSLRAVFGKLPEGEERERLITTPSAVLAVRGTEYGVEVEGDGDTTVAVLEGTVEIRDAAGTGEWARVQAGQAIRIQRGKPPSPPRPHGLTAADWDRGRRPDKPGMANNPQSPGLGAAGQQGSGSGRSSSAQGGSRRRGG